MRWWIPAFAGMTNSLRRPRAGGDPEFAMVDSRLRGNDKLPGRPCAGGDPSSIKLIRQISPRRVHLFNQIYLPFAIPFLDPLFPLNRFIHIGMKLEINKIFDLIFPSKSRYFAGSMGINTARNITADPDVERAVGLAGEDVYDGLLHP